MISLSEWTPIQENKLSISNSNPKSRKDKIHKADRWVNEWKKASKRHKKKIHKENKYVLMLRPKELNLTKLKEVTFRASYTEMREKLNIIIPKNYHNDVNKMSKPVEVIVKDLESD